MKKLITLLALTLSLTAFAQEHLKIKGIPIDGSEASFIAKLKAKGLTASRFNAQDRPVLQGSFANLGKSLFIIVSDSHKNVCKVVVLSDGDFSWSTAKSEYLDLKESLSEKYTKGNSYEYFRSPYYEGDGYEEQAFSLEKAVYTTFFSCDEGDIQLSIEEFGSHLSVKLVYEDKINFDKFDEENAKKAAEDI